MKKQIPFYLLFVSSLAAQTDSIQSGVYYWDRIMARKTIDIAPVVKGTATDFSLLDIEVILIKPGEILRNGNLENRMEELIIVKEGTLKVTLSNNNKTVGPGSVALIMPGEEYSAENTGEEQAALYSMKYTSKSPPDIERGKKAGGSLIVNWNDLEFKKHDRGGIRQYFERSTVMSKRFEMHVTTLNGEIKSHEPHTHRAEEIVLILDGNVEMQIGEGFHKASVGDVIYLGSNVPHALRNTGKESCMYFAFQFE